MKTMKFYKDIDSKWYADVPTWEGEKWELEMVCGADTMLEIAAQGEAEVHIMLSTQDFTNDPDDPYAIPEGIKIDTLTKIKDTPDIGGALYLMKEYKGIEYNLEVWLCHVTSFVFGELPETIYLY